MFHKLNNTDEIVSFKDLLLVAELPLGTRLNFEKSRKGFKGNSVQFVFKKALKTQWIEMSDIQQYALSVLVKLSDNTDELKTALSELPNTTIIESRDMLHGVFDKSDREQIIAVLKTLKLELNEEQTKMLCSCELPDDFGNLSSPAIIHKSTSKVPFFFS